MCAFWVTLTNHFDLKAWLWVDGPQAEGRACSGARRGALFAAPRTPRGVPHDFGTRHEARALAETAAEISARLGFVDASAPLNQKDQTASEARTASKIV